LRKLSALLTLSAIAILPTDARDQRISFKPFIIEGREITGEGFACWQPEGVGLNANFFLAIKLRYDHRENEVLTVLQVRPETHQKCAKEGNRFLDALNKELRRRK
jgi:hypothetical protein